MRAADIQPGTRIKWTVEDRTWEGVMEQWQHPGQPQIRRVAVEHHDGIFTNIIGAEREVEIVT